MYKVSIIIACYNHEKTIQRAVESVLAQKTEYSIEIIIIDDGSKDGSWDKIQKYKDQENITIKKFPHRGLMHTYNFGFDLAKGEYIAVCDADDFWCDPDKLQKQVEYMEQNKDCSLCTTLVRTELCR